LCCPRRKSKWLSRESFAETPRIESWTDPVSSA
jgi:hypothetical protein